MRTSDDDTSLVQGAVEAAQMMVQLCEVGSSRVAVIPFDNAIEVNTGGTSWNKLLSVNNATTRRRLAADIGKLRPKFNTNVGAALQAAYDLLENRLDGEHDGNNPMILLLSDGEPYLEKSEDTARTKELALSVAGQCKDKYPIYCIALLGRDNNKNYSGENLEEYANRSGGLMFETRSPSQLPEFFNIIFAHHIGSEILEVPYAIDENGKAILTVTIPNRSVLEANVVIGMDTTGRGFSAPRVTDPAGNVHAGQDENVWVFSTEAYYMVKLVNPGVGPWTIAYTPSGEQQVQASLLTSYTLQYAMDAFPDTVEKMSAHTFTTRFWDGDAPSTDESLYKGGINAVLRFMDEGFRTLMEAPMTPSEDGMAFEAAVEMAYPSGEYYVSATAHGDGLLREIGPVRVTIANSAPVSARAFDAVEMTIDRIFDEEPYSPDTHTVGRLNDFFTEPNGEEMSFAVSSADPGIVSCELRDNQLILHTGGEAGKTTITVTAKDIPEGLTCSETFTVDVTSIESLLTGRYTLHLSPGGSDIQPKDNDVPLRAALLRADGGEMTPQDSEWAQSILDTAEIRIDMRINETPVEAEALPVFRPAETPGILEAQVHTGMTEEVYDIAMRATLQSLAYDAQAWMTVANTPPYVREDAALIPDEMWIEPLLPGQEAFDAQSIDLDTVFGDLEDPELTYSIGDVTYSDPEKESLSLSVPESGEEKGRLSIAALHTGEALFTVIAQDGDQMTAMKTFGISVRSHTAEFWQAVLRYGFYAVIGLIIFWLLWLTLLKPAIPAGRSFTVLLRGDVYASINLRRGRRNMTLNSVYPNGITSIPHPGALQLRRVKIKPASGDRLKVKAKLGGKNSGIWLEVNGKRLRHGKSAYVGRGQTFTLHIGADGDTDATIGWKYV